MTGFSQAYVCTEGCVTGPIVNRPSPRRAVSLTICICNYKGRAAQRQLFLLSYLKTLSDGLARVSTHGLSNGSPMLNQLSQPGKRIRIQLPRRYYHTSLIIWCRKKRHFVCLANNDILRAFTLGTIKLPKNLHNSFPNGNLMGFESRARPPIKSTIAAFLRMSYFEK